MTYFQDFLSILSGAGVLFWASERTISLGVLGGSIGLASLCWWICSQYSSLWNRSYKITVFHHLMCAFAALITLVALIVSAAFKHALPAALTSVDVWEIQLLTDQEWANQTMIDAYHRVRNLGLEDFTNHPPPSNAGSSIPITHERSKIECALTYAEAGASHFNRSRPYLSSVVKARSEVPRDLLREDMAHYFKNIGTTYPAKNAVALVAREVKAGLGDNLPQVVKSLRLQLIVLLFITQLIPFGLVGWGAYRDLKVRC
jgi:hypothetical protein